MMLRFYSNHLTLFACTLGYTLLDALDIRYCKSTIIHTNHTYLFLYIDYSNI